MGPFILDLDFKVILENLWLLIQMEPLNGHIRLVPELGAVQLLAQTEQFISQPLLASQVSIGVQVESMLFHLTVQENGYLPMFLCTTNMDLHRLGKTALFMLHLEMESTPFLRKELKSGIMSMPGIMIVRLQT